MLQNLPLTLQGFLPAFPCFGLVFVVKIFCWPIFWDAQQDYQEKTANI